MNRDSSAEPSCGSPTRTEHYGLLFVARAPGDRRESLAVAEKVQARAVEQVAVLDHHPVAASVEQREARLGASLENLHRAADWIETIVDAPEAEHGTADFAEALGHVRYAHRRQHGARLRRAYANALGQQIRRDVRRVVELERQQSAHRLGVHRTR